MDKRSEDHNINEIVDSLTSKLFYHGHPINRTEAKDEVGLKTVVCASDTLEKLMWSLYLGYEAEVKMEEPFEASSEFLAQHPNPPPPNGAMTPVNKAKIAFIESTARTDVFTMDYKLAGQPQIVMTPTGPLSVAGGVQVALISQRRGWEVE